MLRLTYHPDRGEGVTSRVPRLRVLSLPTVMVVHYLVARARVVVRHVVVARIRVLGGGDLEDVRFIHVCVDRHDFLCEYGTL